MASIIERSAPIFPCFSVIIDFFCCFHLFHSLRSRACGSVRPPVLQNCRSLRPSMGIIQSIDAAAIYRTACDPAPVDQSARRSCRSSDPSVHRWGSHSPSTPRPSISQPAIPRSWISPPAGLSELPIPPSIDGDHTVHRRRGHLFHSLRSRARGSVRPPVLQNCRSLRPSTGITQSIHAAAIYFTACDPAPVDQSARRSCRSSAPTIFRPPADPRCPPR